MTDRSRLLRGGARAVTGLLVVAAAGATAVLAGTVELPSVTVEPLAITVDTTQNTTRTLVCAGAFAELGADTSQPGVAIPAGEPTLALSGSASGNSVLARSSGDSGLPGVITASASDPLATVQTQTVNSDSLRGTVASSCTEPVNEQWLIGGATSLGISTTLSLGNPGSVPATVTISVYDENGAVDAVQTAGVLVAPGTQQIVSVNGYAPDRERLAVRVESTGAPVTAHLGVAQSSGITPFGASAVTSQVEPLTSLVIPAFENADGDDRGPNDSGEGDAYPVVVRALAPGESGGTATVRAVDRAGKSTDLGTIDLLPNTVGELSVAALPAGANAIEIDADVPIVASAMGSAGTDEAHDFEWFTPASAIAADTEVAVPVAKGGRLVVVNPGTDEAKLEIARSNGSGKPTTATVEPGAALAVDAPADAVLTSSAPVFAGVRIVSGSSIAGYPIIAPDPRDGTLTVYPR
ncbi:DUF5719 family protein [Leucobacter musarum]|uniref:DUF5719 family protein n=1 Tax=Leucobacter musarum TaxID=1930747 RepID=UPI0006A7CEB5|nr:DUF5719 family protein [Leucobacter musarum]